MQGEIDLMPMATRKVGYMGTQSVGWYLEMFQCSTSSGLTMSRPSL